jgi:hypothetical protein
MVAAIETRRTCNRCRQNKSITLFYAAKHCTGGYRPDCIECAKVSLRKQWKKHNARNRRYRRKYQAENRDKILQYLRDYKKKNKEYLDRYDSARAEDIQCRVYGRCHCGNLAIARAGRKAPKESSTWKIAGVWRWWTGRMTRISAGVCHRCKREEDRVYEIENRREKWKGAPEGRLLARMYAEDRDFSVDEAAQLLCVTERHATRLLGNLAKAGDIVSVDGSPWGDVRGYGGEGSLVKRYRADLKARPEEKPSGDIDALMAMMRGIRLSRLPRVKCSQCMVVILDQDKEKKRHADLHMIGEWYNRVSPVFYKYADMPAMEERAIW